MKQYVPFLAAALGAITIFFSGCSGAPPAAPQTAPAAAMVLDRIEASGPDEVTLRFFVHVSNPGTEELVMRLERSRVFVNGKELSSGYHSGAEVIRAAPGAEEKAAALCTLSLKNLDPSLPLETEELDTKTIMEFAFAFDGGGAGSVVTAEDASFPRIREPLFSIVSIAIMQAELINTRLKVKIRIENPNPFPAAFSSLSYELYGHGRFWAGGSETNLCTIPAKGAAEEELFLVMNFINMQRNLLDQVIAMRRVRYRFTGTAEIGTGVEYLPSFTSAFDIQGNSEVLR
ncbi:MAG: LEA type 2 family protein [Treponema sp.]|jgi:LEA14-like dessication related protein|nr:LEA type 2 family protein [Treponema sp.]